MAMKWVVWKQGWIANCENRRGWDRWVYRSWMTKRGRRGWLAGRRDDCIEGRDDIEKKGGLNCLDKSEGD